MWTFDDFIKRALETYGLGVRSSVAAGEGVVKVRYKPTGLSELCRATRVDWSPWGGQGGCPTCSFVGILVSRAYHGPVKLVSVAEEEGGVVELSWEVPTSSPA